MDEVTARRFVGGGGCHGISPSDQALRGAETRRRSPRKKTCAYPICGRKIVTGTQRVVAARCRRNFGFPREHRSAGKHTQITIPAIVQQSAIARHYRETVFAG